MFVRFSCFLFATMAFVPGAFAAFNQAAQIVAGALLFPISGRGRQHRGRLLAGLRATTIVSVSALQIFPSSPNHHRLGLSGALHPKH
ncbi:MAG: hypothetical protein IPG56_11530 [Caulobacteraceae bacterium]|nr:hypothetical protein [Caulobacteraceae bacterium]